MNSRSAFLDASNIYGASTDRSLSLRAFDGGRLKIADEATILPLNVDGVPMSPRNDARKQRLTGSMYRFDCIVPRHS